MTKAITLTIFLLLLSGQAIADQIHAIRNERTKLDLLGGFAWNKEYFKGDFNDRSSAEAQAGPDARASIQLAPFVEGAVVFLSEPDARR